MRVSVKSAMSTPVTLSSKLIVTVPAFVLRGSGVTSTMFAVGAVVSTTHESLASAASAFDAASVIPEPLAASESKYVPAVPVMPLKLPSVQVMLSLVVNVCEAVNRSPPPLRVSTRSPIAKPSTGSLKLIVIVLTELLRGSGVTSMMSAVSAVVSIVHDSIALLASALFA